VTLPRDLLEQAELLAKKERRRPKQASLRRAVSTAYYALFHLLIEDAAGVLSPSSPVALRKVVARAFQHAQIRNSCKDFVQADASVANRNPTHLPAHIEKLVSFPLSADLIAVLSTFVDLQEARHAADYDLFEQWNRVDVLNKILTTRNAFTSWYNVRKTINAAIFMTSMLFRKDWGK
jgi:hypothetical protein